MVNPVANFSADSEDFNEFCAFLKKVSGITISPDKSYLVTSRLRKIMIDHDFSSLSELVNQLSCNHALQKKVVDVMTTNETFWFRDNHPFDFFTNTLLPYFEDDSQFLHRTIRIWSAACSSGQEPYSLAMLLEEYKERKAFSKPVEIIATDLSSHILSVAQSGEYDQLSIGRGLSNERLEKFFTPTLHKSWKVNANISKHIRFQSLNLLNNYSSLGKFDIIYCRNVLIYFTRETKNDILMRMHASLNPGGYLILGSSEGLGDVGSLFEMINCRPGLVYKAK